MESWAGAGHGRIAAIGGHLRVTGTGWSMLGWLLSKRPSGCCSQVAVPWGTPPERWQCWRRSYWNSLWQDFQLAGQSGTEWIVWRLWMWPSPWWKTTWLSILKTVWKAARQRPPLPTQYLCYGDGHQRWPPNHNQLLLNPPPVQFN